MYCQISLLLERLSTLTVKVTVVYLPVCSASVVLPTRGHFIDTITTAGESCLQTLTHLVPVPPDGPSLPHAHTAGGHPLLPGADP